jgi:hypothetical protein
MLRSLAEPEGYRLEATDGEIGRCHDFLFDDRDWAVRYMVADTGRWLPGRRVLVLTGFLGQPDWDSRHFPVNLTRRQIEEAPPLDADAPVSRRYEQTYHDFFATPYYWMGNGLWGNYPDPAAGLAVTPRPSGEAPEAPEEDPEATRLRSVREVTGYRVSGRDGEPGRVADFIVDDRTWALRFLVVDTSRLPFSRRVLLAVEWIDEVDWVDQKVHVDLPAERIEEAPEFDPREPLNEARETVYYDYYGRPRGRAADVNRGR